MDELNEIFGYDEEDDILTSRSLIKKVGLSESDYSNWLDDEILALESVSTKKVGLSESEFKDWVDDLRSENKMYKIFDNIDIEEMELYLRQIKIKRIMKK